MGSRYGIPNKAEPMWLAPARAARPACFEVVSWEQYLIGIRHEAMASRQLRRHLERGGSIDHCAGCRADNRIRMEAAGRCFPCNRKETASAA